MMRVALPAAALALLLPAAALAQTSTTTATAGAPQEAAAQRAAVIGVLDKRVGNTAEFRLKPGERFEFGRLRGVMQTCERTEPYEPKQSAAFVQIIDQVPALRRNEAPPPKTVFSGWLFAESPSLNPFVHQVYDVWLSSCTIDRPDRPSAPAPSGN